MLSLARFDIDAVPLGRAYVQLTEATGTMVITAPVCCVTWQLTFAGDLRNETVSVTYRPRSDR